MSSFAHLIFTIFFYIPFDALGSTGQRPFDIASVYIANRRRARVASGIWRILRFRFLRLEIDLNALLCGYLLPKSVSLRFHPEKRCECRTLSGIYIYIYIYMI